MYQIGEVVAYGATGICTIEDICLMSPNRSGAKKQEYYVLKPLAAPTCLTYVPTASPLTQKMRRLLSGQEIDSMIDSVREQRLDWIEDARQRADVFGSIVSGGLTKQLLLLIGCLYMEKKACCSHGRRFSPADDRLLHSAERVVSEEFSYALQIKPNQVTAYIAQRLNQTM
jgi:RNA polymerase-interacting CarD/CdnL/TRCF family regulator